MIKRPITFVLPGQGTAGGIRVSVEMANSLIKAECNVRIVYRKTAFASKYGLKLAFSRFLLRFKKDIVYDWLHHFNGPVIGFKRLKDISFKKKEFVIAVGMMTIKEVDQLNKDVIKIRYCHGFQDTKKKLSEEAWTPKMRTIVVSSTMVKQLKELTGEKDIEVIPNGIDVTKYFREKYEKDGIGTIYSNAYLKAPELIVELFNEVHNRWPSLKQYLFGHVSRPGTLTAGNYFHLPTIAKAREIYNRCKIWIVASTFEGFGLPILEAMACGCVVISTDQPGGRELIRHGNNGFLVPINDKEAFLKHIDEIVKDDNLRKRIMEKGMETAAQFRWELSSKKMINYLMNIKKEVSNTGDIT